MPPPTPSALLQRCGAAHSLPLLFEHAEKQGTMTREQDLCRNCAGIVRAHNSSSLHSHQRDGEEAMAKSFSGKNHMKAYMLSVPHGASSQASLMIQ